MEFLKKINKTSGILACAITIIINFVLLSIGTGMIRLEFYYVTQVLIPCLFSKAFLIIWCLYFALSYEYDKSARTYTKFLIPFIFLTIIILIIDKNMVWLYIFQSATTLLILILMSNLINQKRFALRAKDYADKLYQLDILIKICIFLSILLTAFSVVIAKGAQKDEIYITILIATMVSQVFIIVGIFCIENAEKKFKQSLAEGTKDILKTSHNGDIKNEN